MVVRHRGAADHDEDAVREPDGTCDRTDLPRPGRLQRRPALRPARASTSSRRARSPLPARTWASRPRPRCAPSWPRSSAPTPAGWGLVNRNTHSAAWPAARPPLILRTRGRPRRRPVRGRRPPRDPEHPGGDAVGPARGRGRARGAGPARQGLAVSPCAGFRSGRARSSTFSAAGTASSRSSGTRPMRVRRSSRSSTVAAPSWVTPKTSSARVACRPARSARAARPRAGRWPPSRRRAPQAPPSRSGAPAGRALRGPRARSATRRRGGAARRCGTASGVEPAGPDRPVDRVLGHPPVGGQLAADDGHHAGRARPAPRACARGRPWCVPVSSRGRRPAYAPITWSRRTS